MPRFNQQGFNQQQFGSTYVTAALAANGNSTSRDVSAIVGWFARPVSAIKGFIGTAVSMVGSFLVW